MESNLVKTNTSTGFQQCGVLFKHKGGEKNDNFFYFVKTVTNFYIINKDSKSVCLDTKEAVLLI